jgi:hypothetical protein
MKTLLFFDQVLDEIRTMEDVYYGSYSESDGKIHTTSSGKSQIITDFNNFSTINLCYENDFDGSIKSKSFFFCLNQELFNFNLIVLLDTHITKRPKSIADEDLVKLGLIESISNLGEGSLISRLLLVSKYNAHPTYFVSSEVELARWNTKAELRRPGTSDVFTVGCPFCGHNETALNRDKDIFNVITSDVVNVLFGCVQDRMNILSFVDELNDWADSVEGNTYKNYVATSGTINRSDK